MKVEHGIVDIWAALNPRHTPEAASDEDWADIIRDVLAAD